VFTLKSVILFAFIPSSKNNQQKCQTNDPLVHHDRVKRRCDIDYISL